MEAPANHLESPSTPAQAPHFRREVPSHETQPDASIQDAFERAESIEAHRRRATYAAELTAFYSS